MKVLHVIPSLWRGDGGPAHAIRAMEAGLAASGVQVETAATDDDGPGRRNGLPCAEAVLEEDALRWYFAKRSDFYKVAPGFTPWLARNISRFDLVHVHGLFSWLPHAAASVARSRGVPYVVRPMGSLGAYGLRHRRPWLKKISLRLREGNDLRRAAAVHFTSAAEADEARVLGLRLREALVPLGIPVPAGPRRWNAAGPDATALYLSRLDPKKNLESVLDAMASRRDGLSRFRLQVAGDGEASYVRLLKERAVRLGVQGRVDWLGHVEGSRKDALLARADFFVLPSFSENFGIAAAEAMAAGLPCLLGEGIAIAREAESAGAAVVVSPSTENVATGLLRLMDGDARTAMSRSAHQLARDSYSLEVMGGRLRALYSSIIGAAP